MSRRRNTYDLCAALRKKIRSDMSSTIARVPLINYGAALYAVSMVRKFARQADKELGRKVSMNAGRRRKRSRR